MQPLLPGGGSSSDGVLLEMVESRAGMQRRSPVNTPQREHPPHLVPQTDIESLHQVLSQPLVACSSSMDGQTKASAEERHIKAA